jgi:predicted membrane GTPase involved in stress response
MQSNHFRNSWVQNFASKRQRRIEKIQCNGKNEMRIGFALHVRGAHSLRGRFLCPQRGGQKAERGTSG